ncbi:Phosphoglycolate phosphatase [Pedobacter cryoconitis]|uniref:Phosphoglycolate phosphatase n=1 Tax=Pedobacter cryoconitis TaxID=188932 RepID=A0A127V793_9SPHI|nr:HAD-IA family hydrolase [Pedobacter cryoconitis]AMP97242.1 Phosphoglycolate phosphatase [Pedobacter cryoconitis]
MDVINWKKIKVLILDVDGTLYNQSGLRRRMLYALLKYYLVRPIQLKDLLILYFFRSERGKRAGYCSNNLEIEQYQWCAAKVGAPLERIKRVVSKWMFEFPNPYLYACRYAELYPFLQLLKEHQIKVAIYSDYSAVEKLKALKIEADLVIASTDKEINCLKPKPIALFHIMKHFEVGSAACLYIGDRDELDGICADEATIRYLNINKYNSGTLYTVLANSLREHYK